MYGLLWDKLPGNTLVKLIITLIIIAAIFLLLMEVVFPWVSTLMPYNDVAI